MDIVVKASLLPCRSLVSAGTKILATTMLQDFPHGWCGHSEFGGRGIAMAFWVVMSFAMVDVVERVVKRGVASNWHHLSATLLTSPVRRECLPPR